MWSAGTTFMYQWSANGAAIEGATTSTLAVTADLKGKRIAVTVVGSLHGYADRAKASKSTAKAASGTLTAKTPRISDTTPAVGDTLTVDPGAWTAGATFTYQWYANGKAVKGATTDSLLVASGQKGKQLSVKVTGHLTGYTARSTTSAKTKKTAAAPVAA